MGLDGLPEQLLNKNAFNKLKTAENGSNDILY